MPTAWPGSTPSGAATSEKSVPTLSEIDAMATVAGLDQQMRNHRHAMAMGAAQLREHYGAKFEEPDDVGITWNSPTINHPPSNGLARLGLGALAGGLGSLGVAAALGGEASLARSLPLRLFPLARAMFLESNPIPIKTAMRIQGIDGGHFRLPLCEMSESNEVRLRQVLAAYESRQPV